MSTEYIGIDLHKTFFQVCALRPEGERLWESRFPTTPAGVTQFLERCTRAEARVTVEATGPVWPFVDQLVDQVQTVSVIDPRKTKLKAGYAAKTDRLDARRLADALRRDSVVAIYYPPIAIRDLRELCRHRATLVRFQVRLKQRVQALLLRTGVQPPALSDLFGARGQQWLQHVTLQGWAGQSFRELVTLWKIVRAQLLSLEVTVRAEAERDAIARALDTIVGIGPILALMIRAEVGTIARFPHPKQLASYAGVVPRVSQSGAHRWHGPITRAGSPWLRWALIEAALHGVKRRDAVGRWARGLAVRKGALKARVALARVLCDEIFQVWHTAERLSASVVEKDMVGERALRQPTDS